MKREDISHAVGNIDSAYVQEIYGTSAEKKKRPVWLKWGAIAACLCLVIGIAIPYSMQLFGPRGGPDDPTAQDIGTLEFNGLYYEVTDIDWVLEKYGLPAEITAEVTGEHLSYLELNDNFRYEETVFETDIELLQYTPAPCRGVLVLRNGNSYQAALFVGIHTFDSNTHSEMEELYRIYDIERASDIVSLSIVDGSTGEQIGAKVTDFDSINDFFSLSQSLMSYGEDDYQHVLYENLSSKARIELNHAMAADQETLCIEASNGLRIFIILYPEHGWINARSISTHFKMSEEFISWYKDSFV